MISDTTDVTYQVAQESGGGLIKTRDFVNVRSYKKINTSWIIASMSIIYNEIPVTNKYVRYVFS